MFKIIHIPTARIVSLIDMYKGMPYCTEYCFFDTNEQALFYLNRPWTSIILNVGPLRAPDNSVFLSSVYTAMFVCDKFNYHEFEVVEVNDV